MFFDFVLCLDGFAVVLMELVFGIVCLVRVVWLCFGVLFVWFMLGWWF